MPQLLPENVAVLVQLDVVGSGNGRRVWGSPCHLPPQSGSPEQAAHQPEGRAHAQDPPPLRRERRP